MLALPSRFLDHFGRPVEREPIVLAFDGGARSPHTSAYACCVWIQPGKPIWWSATALSPGGTNNEMEAQALLTGLRWVCSNQRHRTIRIIGDSAIVVSMAASAMRVKAHNLAPYIRQIRQLLTRLRLVGLQWVPRAFNVAPDALCNWIMDHSCSRTVHVDSDDMECPLTPEQWDDPATRGCPPFEWVTQQEYDHKQWLARWSLVMLDLRRVEHLVRRRFLRQPLGRIPSSPHGDKSRSTVETTARTELSPFDTKIQRECIVHGIPRCVPLGVFRKFQSLAVDNHISFPINRIFRKPGPDRLTLPLEDVAFLTAIVRLPGMGIEGTLREFRGQTSRDGRPNKALRSKMYRRHLASYPELELLCSIAEQGVVPHWRHPEARIGVRPIPRNYPSAISGGDVVTHRLLKDYYAGRCILATVSALSVEPGFHSSAFALVPKKDIPLAQDGRIIHDLSAPPGRSVNDATDPALSPDARWDQFSCIALRVVELRIRYPGCSIYALVADIAEAFHHVPMHARHSSAFGGTFPRSQIGIVSGMAVFGWTASPGFFAVMGKASRHYQRSGHSYINGYPEQFWVFQWVDDIVIIEVDVGDRLLQAERRLRDAIKLVFGSDGWHEGKFSTWSQNVHAVGIDWNIPDNSVTIPQRKINKTKQVVSDTLTLKFVSLKRLDSVVGVLRHIITFIPIAKPFIQRLVAVQLVTRRSGRSGTPMTESLRADLLWWKQLVFENEFAGVPVTMFDSEPPEADGWVILHHSNQVTAYGLTPMRSQSFTLKATAHEADLAWIILQLVEHWIAVDPDQTSWGHIRVYVMNRWESRLLETMNSRDPEAQQHLRTLALAQAQRKLRLTASRILERTSEPRPCDVHSATDEFDRYPFQAGWSKSRNRQPNSNEHLSTVAHCERTRNDLNTGSNSAKSSVFPSGSTVSHKTDRHESSACSPDCVPSKDITPVEKETSSRRSTARWQQSHLPIKVCGMHDSATRLRNLSSLLGAISAPTAAWTGNNQSPHPCCSRCGGS